MMYALDWELPFEVMYDASYFALGGHSRTKEEQEVMSSIMRVIL